MIKGIDISNYQGTPDFNQVKSQVDFAILKASEGIGYQDPTLKTNQANVRSAGVLRGFYHFARPDLGNTAQAEADYFLSTIGALEDGELLILDYEVNYADPVNWCKSFLDEVASKTGCKPLIYLNLSLVQANDWSSVINAGYGLYLADYDGVDNDAPNTPWPLVAMKQWTSAGSISGIAGNVDLDVFFGDATAYQLYGYKAPTAPEPTPSVISDSQTKIQVGVDSHSFDWGVMEVGAIRSTLGDQKAAMDNQQKGLDTLNAQLDDKSSTITSLTASTGAMQTQITDLQKQVADLSSQSVVKPVGFWAKLSFLFS